MPDPFGIDLRLLPVPGGGLDLAGGDAATGTVSGLDNLVQALTVRLLVDRGELAGLGHPRFGSQVRELLGETLDTANLELLRRYVRKALLQDPRVEEVTAVAVRPRIGAPGTVEVNAAVRAVDAGDISLQVILDAG
jgi:phage baseplate assembly protein W